MSICTISFSLDEKWISFGFEYGNVFEYEKDADDSYIGSLGINATIYSFIDKMNAGIFAHFSGMFPVTGIDNYNSIGMYEFTGGPAYRVPFNEKLTLFGGVGIHFMKIYTDYSKDSIDYSAEGTNWGVGGDIGLKYDITDIVFINIGTTVSGDFTNNAKTGSSSGYTVKTPTDYMMFSVKPYIGIGINGYTKEAHYGKPK